MANIMPTFCPVQQRFEENTNKFYQEEGAPPPKFCKDGQMQSLYLNFGTFQNSN